MRPDRAIEVELCRDQNGAVGIFGRNRGGNLNVQKLFVNRIVAGKLWHITHKNVRHLAARRSGFQAARRSGYNAGMNQRSDGLQRRACQLSGEKGMDLSQLQREAICKLRNPRWDDQPDSQETVSELTKLGLVSINPKDSRLTLTELGEQVYRELIGD